MSVRMQTIRFDIVYQKNVGAVNSILEWGQPSSASFWGNMGPGHTGPQLFFWGGGEIGRSRKFICAV